VAKKKVPVRSCVACRQALPKKELIRIVHTLSGTVEVDTNGKAAGRGAYLCPREACWSLALRKDRLDHGLRTTLLEKDKETLVKYYQQFKPTENGEIR
jgi:predicted RNA-binding protein YlxR (DUF448 family)